MSIKKNPVSRREFGKKVAAGVAGVAAAAALPMTGSGCPITYDQFGNRQFWVCVIDVLLDPPGYGIYRYEVCSTGQTHVLAGPPNIPPGSCLAPAAPSCVDKRRIQRLRAH